MKGRFATAIIALASLLLAGCSSASSGEQPTAPASLWVRSGDPQVQAVANPATHFVVTQLDGVTGVVVHDWLLPSGVAYGPMVVSAIGPVFADQVSGQSITVIDTTSQQVRSITTGLHDAFGLKLMLNGDHLTASATAVTTSGTDTTLLDFDPALTHVTNTRHLPADNPADALNVFAVAGTTAWALHPHGSQVAQFDTASNAGNSIDLGQPDVYIVGTMVGDELAMLVATAQPQVLLLNPQTKAITQRILLPSGVIKSYSAGVATASLRAMGTNLLVAGYDDAVIINPDTGAATSVALGLCAAQANGKCASQVDSTSEHHAVISATTKGVVIDDAGTVVRTFPLG